MWAFETAATTNAAPERVWEVWTDVAGWSVWHPGIAQATLDEPFGPGACGSSRAPGGPPSRLTIAEVEAGRSFVSETRLPLLHLRFEHVLSPEAGGGTRIVYRVRMTGAGTPAFRRILGPRLEARMPEAARGLAALAAD